MASRRCRDVGQLYNRSPAKRRLRAAATPTDAADHASGERSPVASSAPLGDSLTRNPIVILKNDAFSVSE